MASKTRIYEVPADFDKDGKAKKAYLVEAVSLVQAREHVAKKYVGAALLPNGKRIAELMGSGTKVEPAMADEPAPGTNEQPAVEQRKAA